MSAARSSASASLPSRGACASPLEFAEIRRASSGPCASSRGARGERPSVGAAQQHRELVAAETPGEHLRALLRAQCLGEPAQQRSPAAWPIVLLITPNPSRSNSSSETGSTHAGARARRLEPGAEGRAREQRRQVVVVGIPARAAQQAVELDRQSPDRQQQPDRRDDQPGVFGGQALFANHRQRQREQDDGAPDPVDATAARHHAARDRGEPEDAEHVDALVAETDDQHGCARGQRLLDAQPRDAARAEMHDGRQEDRREPGQAERRIWQQSAVRRNQDDAGRADRDTRPCRRAPRPADVVVAFDRDHCERFGSRAPQLDASAAAWTAGRAVPVCELVAVAQSERAHSRDIQHRLRPRDCRDRCLGRQQLRVVQRARAEPGAPSSPTNAIASGASSPKKAKSSEPHERHGGAGASSAPGSSSRAPATIRASFSSAGSPSVSSTAPRHPCAAAVPETTSFASSRSAARSPARRRAARPARWRWRGSCSRSRRPRSRRR